MELHLRRGDDSRSEIGPLAALVYPREILATIVWRDVTWAHADWRMLVYDDARLVSVVGLYLRDASLDGGVVRIGGVGGVMTHPEHRQRGFAGAALRHAQDFFAGESGIDFALLFCEPKNIAFYAGRLWRVFPGEVMVEQPSGRGAFALMTAMVRGVRGPAPTGGRIDLRGLPW
jgi:aminoglycoside 2'-N-acetyltransferase I